MKPLISHSQILEEAATLLDKKIVNQELASDGADHIVFKLWLEDGKIVIVKTGPDATTDAYVLNLLNDKDILVPKLIAESQIAHDGKNYGLVIISCYDGQMLRTLPKEEQYKYIGPIIEEMNKVHQIKSSGNAGYVSKVANGDGWTWKDFLLRPFKGEDPDINWKRVFEHKNVNKAVLEKAIELIQSKILELDDNVALSLVNTDLNQSNIFIKENKLEGIIDWSDSIYGDTLFDFARLRMNINHRMDKHALKEYYSNLNLSEKQKEIEEIYYLWHIIIYVAHYVDYGWDEIVTSQMKMVEEVIED